jgi:hypothetical protein
LSRNGRLRISFRSPYKHDLATLIAFMLFATPPVAAL